MSEDNRPPPPEPPLVRWVDAERLYEALDEAKRWKSAHDHQVNLKRKQAEMIDRYRAALKVLTSAMADASEEAKSILKDPRS